MNMFTWVSGPSSTGGTGTYGTQGIPDVNNIPPVGMRIAVSAGCLWHFLAWGGIQEGGNGWVFNDLWKYRPSTKEWTWVSGENTGNFTGSYGTQEFHRPQMNHLQNMVL
jgi:hypothetical protein